MELDVKMESASLSIPIANPFALDVEGIARQIEAFVAAQGISLAGLDLRGLLPKMVRGIAGCEGGCPANALQLVESGFRSFELAYIEGGILTAKATIEGRELSLKMFPDF
ncbi:MAG: hypothetical protein AB1805_10445 [Nitrospirota bacterium]